MPTIETRIAPAGTATYRAKIRRKGAPAVSASYATPTRLVSALMAKTTHRTRA